MQPKSFKVGEAPWETEKAPDSFPVGQAPWEKTPTAPTVSSIVSTPERPPTMGIESGDTREDGFFKSFIKDPIGTLVVKPALRVSQATAGVIGKVTGNQNLVDTATEGATFDVPILGKYYLPALEGTQGVKEIAGEALKTASYLAPAGAAERAGASLFKGAVMKGAGSGAVAGAEFGALSGAGESVKNEDATFGSVLEDTLLGAGVGAAGGAAFGAGGALASKAITPAAKLVKDVTPGYLATTKTGQKILGEEGVATAKEKIYQKLADTNSGILNMTKNQVVKEERFNKDTPMFIAKEAPDVGWDVSKEGRLNTQPVIDALEPKYHAEAQAFNMALKDSGQYGNLDELQRNAVAEAKRQFKGTAQDDAIAKIDNEILAYKKQYASSIINHNGETIIPIHIIDDIKSDLWSKTKFWSNATEATQSQTSYLMGSAAKDMIEKTVSDAPIKAWNKRLGDFAEAIKILNQRNGIKVSPGAYSKTGARIVGAIAGHSLGGVPGELAGMVTADQLVKFAADPNVKSYVFKKLLQKMDANGQRGIIEEVQKVMQQRATERQARKILPPPSKQGLPKQIDLPSPGVLEGQQKLRQ